MSAQLAAKDVRYACVECQMEGKRSRVYLVFSYITTMASRTWWDEDGKQHAEDPNYVVSTFRCSNDHTWDARSRA